MKSVGEGYLLITFFSLERILKVAYKSGEK